MEEVKKHNHNKNESIFCFDTQKEQGLLHDQTNNSSIVFEKGPPLHACLDYYLMGNIKKHLKKPLNSHNMKTESLLNLNKPAFGCSTVKKSPLVSEKKNSSPEPGPGAYDQNSSFCDNSTLVNSNAIKSKQ